MKILVIGLACVLLALALNNAAGLATFVDSTSIIFIFIPTMAAFVAVGFKRQGVFIAKGSIIQVAIVGMLIGYIGILQNMSDPEALGPALAISLLVVLYAIIVLGICHLLSVNFEKTSDDAAPPWRYGATGLWIAVCLLAMDGAAGVEAFADTTSALILVALISAIVAIAPSAWSRQLAKYLPTAGFIGVLVGCIGVLQNMQEPKAIGPAIAISLLTLTYCNIVSVSLKLALPNAPADEDMNSLTYLGFVLVFLIFTTAVLSLSFL